MRLVSCELHVPFTHMASMTDTPGHGLCGGHPVGEGPAGAGEDAAWLCPLPLAQ